MSKTWKTIGITVGVIVLLVGIGALVRWAWIKSAPDVAKYQQQIKVIQQDKQILLQQYLDTERRADSLERIIALDTARLGQRDAIVNNINQYYDKEDTAVRELAPDSAVSFLRQWLSEADSAAKRR